MFPLRWEELEKKEKTKQKEEIKSKYMLLWVVVLLLFIPLAYTVNLSPVPVQPHSDLSVKIVQDSYDVNQNPYSPPLQYRDTESYRQIGYLKGATRLPLFGKYANVKRSTFYYYTILDGIKMPITINKRQCSVAPGCNEVSSGDILQVEGVDYRVELYHMDFQ